MPARYHEGGTYAMNRNAAKKGKGDINTVYWYTTIVYLVHTSPFSVVVCVFFFTLAFFSAAAMVAGCTTVCTVHRFLSRFVVVRVVRALGAVARCAR